MRQHRQLNSKTLWGGVIFWPLFLLAVTPLVLTAPVHATDNAVELTIGSDADLEQSADSYLHEATTPVKIKTAELRGFNLTIHADSADLVNTLDSRHRIKGMDRAEILMGINANSNIWGYRLEESYGAKFRPSGFMHVPAGDEAPSVIVDTASEYDNAGCRGKKQCEVHMTFGAAIAPNSLAAGKYSTTVTYTATAKPAPAPTVNPTICKSGDPQNDCQVDLDANMIPVKYTGSTTSAQWTSLANPEDSSNQGNWYNYNQKQWANAVTVKDPSKYKNQTKVVDQSDILGFWVYIPRYAYEVMRRDGTDKPVPAQNFLISFEKTTTPKRHPAVCSEKGKDYRTECSLDRSYIKGQPSNQGTWATHPAFTFGSKELNGIWFAKFETTGDVSNPTVLPNSFHLSSYYSGINGIGSFYSIAKSIGVNDPQNVGGKSVSSPQNSHHLAKLSSHMVSSNDWGAATYLSASKYGAGYNGVQINSQNQSQGSSYSVTGCGPQASGNTSAYSDGGALGTQQACSSSYLQRAYNGTLGQLASTTNNPTGIYDMSGGAYEYTAASYTTNLNESGVSSDGDYFGIKAHPPYVNTYNFGASNGCTFATCGGQALYETLGWNGQYTDSLDSKWVWFGRSGSAYSGSDSRVGVFALFSDSGGTVDMAAFRVALLSSHKD